MYPSLYHFFYDVFGLDINGLKAIKSFGFFVAISFILANTIFVLELKRMEKNGVLHPVMRRVLIGMPVSKFDLLLNATVGFFLGFKLIFAFLHSEVFEDFPGFLFSSSGNLLAGIVGAAIFGYWRYAEGQKKVLPEPKEVDEAFHPYQHAGNITVIAALFGFLGARIFAYLESPVSLSEFLEDPFSGFTVYGGMIVGVLAGTYYLYKKKLPILHFYDAVAPGLIFAYGTGRIGCHVAGDGDWGIVNNSPKPSFLPDWLWAYQYPNNVNQDCGSPGCIWENTPYLIEPVYPTPLYEFLMCMAIFAILWYCRKRIATPGIIFLMYAGFNGIERLLIEQIRINEPYHLGNFAFTQAELISVVLIIGSIAGIYLLLKRNKSNSGNENSSSSK